MKTLHDTVLPPRCRRLQHVGSSRSALHISPHLPISPHISPHLPQAIHTLTTSPQISPHLPISPHISHAGSWCRAFWPVYAGAGLQAMFHIAMEPSLPISPHLSPSLPRRPCSTLRRSPTSATGAPASPSPRCTCSGWLSPSSSTARTTRSGVRIHVSQPAPERTRIPPCSAVFRCIHCPLLRCTHAVL